MIVLLICNYSNRLFQKVLEKFLNWIFHGYFKKFILGWIPMRCYSQYFKDFSRISSREYFSALTLTYPIVSSGIAPKIPQKFFRDILHVFFLVFFHQFLYYLFQEILQRCLKESFRNTDKVYSTIIEKKCFKVFSVSLT